MVDTLKKLFGDELEQIDYVVISPLSRALQTAELCLKGNLTKLISQNKVIMSPIFREILEDYCDVGRSWRSLVDDFSWLGTFEALPPFWYAQERIRKVLVENGTQEDSYLSIWEQLQENNFDTRYEIEARVDKCKNVLSGLFQEGSASILVIAHANLIFEITSVVIQGEVYGQWLSNGEIYTYDLPLGNNN